MIFIVIISTYLLVWGTPLCILMLYRRRYQAGTKRAPFTTNFLRSPGESLNQKIQEVNEEMMLHLLYLTFIPIFLVSLPLLFRGQKPALQLLILGLLVVLSLSVYSVTLWKHLNKRRALRLGYEGEIAVGQELNQLMLSGYHVYHDFQADKFNVDHIVVGSAGVFAIETKARSKPIAKNRSTAYKVIYDGRSIRFPDYSDSATVQQSIRQAKWLRQWLSNAVGDPITVQPIVALPGWFVERVSANGIPVLNPKLIGAFLSAKKQNNLSESMIRRIVHQLEQKCRNVEPMTVQLERELGN